MRKTHEQYEQQLFEKEIDCFPLEKYITSQTPILHECLVGHQWSAKPNNILNGTRCPLCVNNNIKKTTEQYKAEVPSYKVLEEYLGKGIPILHECPKGHQWKVRPNDLLRKNAGCPSCATYGFDGSKPAILYYVKLSKDNETYYKLGITSNTVTERFKAEKDKELTVIKITEFQSGFQARIEEQKLLSQYPRISVKGFLRTGFSELFEYDVLGLEKI